MTHLGPHLSPLVPPGDGDDSEDGLGLIGPVKDPFDIEDFTAASDWERLTAAIEDAIREWGLHGGHEEAQEENEADVDKKGWVWRQDKAKVITFLGFDFQLTHHRLVEPEDGAKESRQSEEDERAKSESEDPDKGVSGTHAQDSDDGFCRAHALPAPLAEMMRHGSDFPAGSHPLHYFFGCSHFLLLSPRGRDELDTSSRARVSLSAAAVAASDTSCSIPIFVQVMAKSKAQFGGLFFSPYFRTEFEMAVLPETVAVADCHHLQDLIRIFRERLYRPLPAEIPLDGCYASVRKTYLLEDWAGSYEWSQSPPDMDLFASFGASELARLPLGATADPIKRLVLNADWPRVNEAMVIENDVHSDFDPRDAPKWSVGVTLDNHPSNLLGEYMKEYSAFCRHHETMRQVLGNFYSERSGSTTNEEESPSAGLALSRLTGPTYGFRDIIRSGKTPSEKKVAEGPIKKEHLTKLLEYLFPDSNPDGTTAVSYPEEFTSLDNQSKEDGEDGLISQLQMQLSSLKTCPVDGFLWRLSVVVAHCLHVLGGIKPVSHLLHEVMLEVRYRFETGYRVPGIPDGPPDHAHCLLHQKLQLLNCCIERKRAREEGSISAERNDDDENKDQSKQSASSDTDEDEFFDCEEEGGEVKSSKKKKQDIPIWESNAEGRETKLGHLRLLEHDAPLYVPVCQEPAPMTEDQLAEQAEVMLQLGMDAEGSELRAKMQSASLLSDMESFKAANPGAVLGDFVRWHSPRDWEEDDGENQGKLSARMESAGNLWQEAWRNAKPVPARRQKRLFDDTREAEKVLQYLTSLKPGELTQMMLPTLLHAATLRIAGVDSLTEMIPKANDRVHESVQVLTKASKIPCRPEVQHYSQTSNHKEDFEKRKVMVDEVISRLQILETKLSQALSLRAKFLREDTSQQVKENASPEDQESVSRYMEDFVRDLYCKPEVNVMGGPRGPTGQLIRRMFLEAKRAAEGIITEEDRRMSEKELNADSIKIFPRTDSSEYVVRTMVRRPFPYSQECPQRVYLCLKGGELRDMKERSERLLERGKKKKDKKGVLFISFACFLVSLPSLLSSISLPSKREEKQQLG